MNKHTLKAIGAVVVGVVFIIVVTTLVNILLHAAGAFPLRGKPPTDAHALLAGSSRLVIGIAGAYLTALLAPDRSLRHAIILGFVGVILGLAGVVGTSGWGPAGIRSCWSCSRSHNAGPVAGFSSCGRAPVTF